MTSERVKSITKELAEEVRSTAKDLIKEEVMSELDDLLGTEAPVATAPLLIPEGETAVNPAPVAEAEVVEEENFEFGDLPEVKRTGFAGERKKRGSKFGFEKFPAPRQGADGQAQYARKFVAYGADVKKTTQSVNSAISTVNGAAKKAGSTVKFTSRKAEAGNGIYIIRIA